MNICCHTFSKTNGYGQWARGIITALEFLGHKVWITPGAVPIPDDLKHLINTRHRPDIIVYPPGTRLDSPVQFTTYESDKLLKIMALELNKHDLVIVPCEQNKLMCKNSKVKAQVCFIPSELKFLDPAPLKPFTFLHIGADNSVPERKRSADVLAAFKQAFPSETDVRLIIKKDPVDPIITNFDNRVEIIYGAIESLEDLYAKSHVGVFPCGQEGWGLCQAEMMARGRPVIVPLYGGPADFCDATTSYVLSYTMRPTPQKVYCGYGQCAWASYDDMVRHMRFCYENPDDVLLKGAMSYRRMMNFTPERMALRLAQLLR